jgi:hypothetical protein
MVAVLRVTVLAMTRLLNPASQTKGTGLLGLSRSIREGYGERGWQATLEALPRHLADPYRFGQVVPVGWYPVAW